MARVTLGDRLEVLASSPYLPVGKRDFAASLLVHYQKRKSLTSGRREWVDRLEEMAEEAKNRDPSEYDAIVADIDDIADPNAIEITGSIGGAWVRSTLLNPCSHTSGSCA